MHRFHWGSISVLAGLATFSLGSGIWLSSVGLRNEQPPHGAARSTVVLESEQPSDRSNEARCSGAGLFVFGAQGDAAMASPYSSGGNPLFLWAELEPEQGVYNWEPLDSAVAGARRAGKRIIPRVQTNQYLFGQATPDWFFALPGAQFYHPSSAAASQEFKASVPWDPLFQEQFGRFLRALGQRYDGNPAIEFFQTNAGGGLYGEMVLHSQDQRLVPGWTPHVHRATIFYWVDRWLEAFPTTALSLMVNYLSHNLGEDGSAYAVSKGFYLQQNSPWLSPHAVALFTANHHRTCVVLEVEDGGCASATGQSFDDILNRIFSYGFPIDYVVLCPQSLSDTLTSARLSALLGRSE